MRPMRERRESGSRGRSSDRGSFRRDSDSRGRSSDRGSFRRDSGSRGRFNRRDSVEKHRVTCDKCGESCEVPFKPTGNKPVYCSDCFKSEGDGPKNSSSDFDQINNKLDKIMKVLDIK